MQIFSILYSHLGFCISISNLQVLHRRSRISQRYPNSNYFPLFNTWVQEFRKFAWIPLLPENNWKHWTRFLFSQIIKSKNDAQLLCIQYSYLCYFNKSFNFCSITLNSQISTPPWSSAYWLRHFDFFLVIWYCYFVW